MHLSNQNCALRLDVVNFRSANFRSLNAHLRIADNTSADAIADPGTTITHTPRFMSIGTSPTRKGGTASGGNKAGAKRHKIHKSILWFLCLFVAIP